MILDYTLYDFMVFKNKIKREILIQDNLRDPKLMFPMLLFFLHSQH